MLRTSIRWIIWWRRSAGRTTISNSLTTGNAVFQFVIAPLSHSALTIGQAGKNVQRQVNIVDGFPGKRFTQCKGRGDFRRLTPFLVRPLINRYQDLTVWRQPRVENLAGVLSGL